jgi:hypothetical protein
VISSIYIKFIDIICRRVLISLMLNFSFILTGLQAAIAVVSARERHLTVLLVVVWGRIGRMRVRLERLIALWRAGMLPQTRAPRAGMARVGVRAPPSALPRAPAWLVAAVAEAAGFGAQLEQMLSQDECVEFLAAVPQARRILRPLCRMLGVGVKPGKARRPRPVWALPMAAPAPARAGLVLGPGGRFLYV